MTKLTQRQLQSLTTLLERREAKVRDALAGEAQHAEQEHYADLTGSVADEGDESSADLIVDTENAVIGHYLEELRDIEAARERIKESRYGACIDCGGEIAFDRLCAYPTAKRCLSCQRRREQGYAEAPHPSL